MVSSKSFVTFRRRKSSVSTLASSSEKTPPHKLPRFVFILNNKFGGVFDLKGALKMQCLFIGDDYRKKVDWIKGVVTS